MRQMSSSIGPSLKPGWRFSMLAVIFADGVIAHEGSWLGAQVFVSFDKKAVKLIEASGGMARLASTT